MQMLSNNKKFEVNLQVFSKSTVQSLLLYLN